MGTERAHVLDLRNDTAINVAGLLQAPTGSIRTYGLRLDRFPLDHDLAAADVHGEVKLTRLREGVMASVQVGGRVELECVRCLRAYDQSFATEFNEEYCQTVDVRTGLGLALDAAPDDETFIIDDNHELDVGEALRQEILVSLPMRPDCGELCPGPDVVESGDASPFDSRFAALERLLAEDEVTTRRDNPSDERGSPRSSLQAS
jgi:uncharacterized metal-binding protein YceD (DUF177 family)